MLTSIQLLFGLGFGWVGLAGIADNPGSGISALVLAGILVLRGIDQMWESGSQAVDE